MLLLLLACATPDDTDKPADTDTAADTDPETELDTDTVPLDEDGDGAKSDIDCDDNDYRVYPGATEVCDGLDNDCDAFTDEGFDADEDGALSAADCEGGTDCDDTDDDVAPGAPETPYDGIDQDCDGADLSDVDGDGYAGGGGLDCDDADATVFPLADDAPKDGIDQNCDGTDNLDGDGDGRDDAALGGDDCDDADAAVFPGAPDPWNDGRDTDCDGADSTVAELADAPASILGDSGAQDLVGQDVALCDLDGDLLLDLVVTAPFGETYLGQVGVFYGDGAATWGPDMLLDDADTLVQSSEMFLGFDVGCADLDGDGYDDLVVGRGEIDYFDYYVADFELVVWYGDGGRLPAAVSEADADARLEMELGVTPDVATVYGRSLTVADLDGDGAAEMVVVNEQDGTLTYADESFYVVGGGRYAGTLRLADEARAVIAGEGIASAVALPDLDGDGVSELLLGENGYTAGDTGDTGDTGGPVYLGRASVVPGDAAGDASVGDLAYGFWVGSGAIELGFAGASGDFDGDGLEDVAVSALADDTYADTAGSVHFFAPAEAAVPSAGSSAEATNAVRGTTTEGFFGYVLRTVADYDGDGAQDLLVAEVLGDEGNGRVWLLSGALAVGGAATPEDAALYAWTGEQADALPGTALAAGDLDADGVTDFVVGAYLYTSDGALQNGKVYLLLSGG